jgi:hypothetical protein
MKKLAFIFALFSTLHANDSIYSQAQKFYSQGSFVAAAKMYESVCSEMEGKAKKICLFNEVKALVESGKADLAAAAEPKLLLLMSQTEPSDSLFTWLSMEDAKLQTMLGNPVRAVRSWNSAQAAASSDYFSELFVLCKDIISAYPSNGLKEENCNKVKPADTSLISLPRKKVVPLVAATTPAPQTQIQTQPQTQPKTQTTEGKWYVQLGAFGSKENAEKLVANFKSKNVQLYIVELPERKLFTVRTGLFSSSNDASVYAEQMIAPSHSDYKVFKD